MLTVTFPYYTYQQKNDIRSKFTFSFQNKTNGTANSVLRDVVYRL